MHGKDEFSKNKGSICNIPIEAANICNILQVHQLPIDLLSLN